MPQMFGSAGAGLIGRPEEGNPLGMFGSGDRARGQQVVQFGLSQLPGRGRGADVADLAIELEQLGAVATGGRRPLGRVRHQFGVGDPGGQHPGGQRRLRDLLADTGRGMRCFGRTPGVVPGAPFGGAACQRRETRVVGCRAPLRDTGRRRPLQFGLRPLHGAHPLGLADQTAFEALVECVDCRRVAFGGGVDRVEPGQHPVKSPIQFGQFVGAVGQRRPVKRLAVQDARTVGRRERGFGPRRLVPHLGEVGRRLVRRALQAAGVAGNPEGNRQLVGAGHYTLLSATIAHRLQRARLQRGQIIQRLSVPGDGECARQTLGLGPVQTYRRAVPQRPSPGRAHEQAERRPRLFEDRNPRRRVCHLSGDFRFAEPGLPELGRQPPGLGRPRARHPAPAGLPQFPARAPESARL